MSSNGIPARQSQTSTSTEYTLTGPLRYLEIRWPLPYRTRNTARNEVRWITLGRDAGGQYLVVVHTFAQLSDELGLVRLISARPPTRAEVKAYEEER